MNRLISVIGKNENTEQEACFNTADKKSTSERTENTLVRLNSWKYYFFEVGEGIRCAMGFILQNFFHFCFQTPKIFDS